MNKAGIVCVPLGGLTFQTVTRVPLNTPKSSLQFVHLSGKEPGCQVAVVTWVLKLARLKLTAKWPISLGSWSWPDWNWLRSGQYHLGPEVGQTEPDCEVANITWVLKLARLNLWSGQYHLGPEVGQTEPDFEVANIAWVLKLARLNLTVKWPVSLGSWSRPDWTWLSSER